MPTCGLPGIFGDHVVLQQEATLPVLGWANPREKVIVAFGIKTAETTAGTDGKWTIDFPALPGRSFCTTMRFTPTARRSARWLTALFFSPFFFSRRLPGPLRGTTGRQH